MNFLTPDLAFRAGSTLALVCWAALALSPPSRRWTATVWRLTGWVVPLTLALVYAALLGLHWGGPGGFGSLQQVQLLFSRPGPLAAGWLHYLAFDLFVGTWIARQAADAGIAHLWVLPCLLLTFLFGPAGLLTFAVIGALHRRWRP
jgi:Domain of unknown function (DUF4281)